ncbi:hypothetical protein BUALT_Bualt19G0122000 [Buddleja alternifolia]|uniref:SWIM-type domain-containing protein n=1 Tax=Buddleja alternifolia TaxID=168488 RepID=A0AAV6W7J1_9LAMI|nr:hypothetical protein BUALT_Bualt19G0122000 [Buddleja alternifolia]
MPSICYDNNNNESDGERFQFNETNGERPEFSETNIGGSASAQSDPTYQGGDDEEESHSDSSSVSDCPSWMFEDFEEWYSDIEEDDLESMRGSDDEGPPSFVWSDDTDMKTFEMIVGLQFPSRKKYREVLRDWAVRKGWDLKFTCNEAAKITAICKHGCDWRIHASPIMKTSTFQLKSLRGGHTCAHRYENKQANYKYLGKRLENIIRDNLVEGLESLKNKIRRDVEVECSMHKVYRAKRYALDLVRGDIKDQYNRLYDYCSTVVKHNPTSNMILQVDRNLNPPVLQKMYFCVAGMREGFLAGCRPIIGLDWCFLKGLFKGQLLTAIGRDGNDNMFPIAMAYVEIEKEETWKWFLNLLLRDIGFADDKGWAFISDRQKGLVEAIHSLAPSSEHRFCLKHMYNNFKVKYKGQDLKKLFWKAASTYSVKQHLRIMKEIERLSPKRGNNQTAYEWMCKISSHHWARCFFPNRTKCDALVNNISESFNSYILDARELPIIDMFECIRRKCMTRLQVKRAGMDKFKGVICPNIQKKIESQRVVSKNCFPTWAGDDKFEVRHFMENHIVYLNDKHCSCGMYQLVGYPCCHAIASLNYHNLEYDDYVDDYLKKDCYMRVYSHLINPMPGMHDFEESPLGMVDPPNVKVRIGRPRKVRRRDGNDRRDPTCVSRVGLTHTCSICLQQGHNKSTCTNPPHPNSTFKNNNARENETENDVESEAAQEEQPFGAAADGEQDQTRIDPQFEMHQQPSQTASSVADQGPIADVHLPTQESSVPKPPKSRKQSCPKLKRHQPQPQPQPQKEKGPSTSISAFKKSWNPSTRISTSRAASSSVGHSNGISNVPKVVKKGLNRQ